MQVESDTMLRILEVIPVGAYVVDQDHNIKYINHQLESRFGPVNGRKCFEYLHGQRRPCAQCKNDAVFLKGKTVRWHRYNKQNGRKYELTDIPLRNSEGAVLKLEIFVDTTERELEKAKLHSYQKSLKRLASQVFLAEEKERRRISLDLHDTIGHDLCMANIQLSALLEQQIDNHIAVQLSEIHEIIMRLIRQTRSLTFEISSLILYDLGLGPALSQLVEYYREKYHFTFTYYDDDVEKPVSDNTLIILFRSARELLMNAVKHSGASKIMVSLTRDKNQIILAVEDNGVGLNADSLDSCKTSGIGLLSVREQMEHIHGWLEIKSEPGRGSRLALLAPVEVESQLK